MDKNPRQRIRELRLEERFVQDKLRQTSEKIMDCLDFSGCDLPLPGKEDRLKRLKKRKEKLRFRIMAIASLVYREELKIKKVRRKKRLVAELTVEDIINDPDIHAFGMVGSADWD